MDLEFYTVKLYWNNCFAWFAWGKRCAMVRKLLKSEGSALVFVVLLMLILSILGLSLLGTALANSKMAVHQENSMKAYFLARSGASALADYIIKTPEADVEGMVSAGATEPEYVADGSIVLDVQEVNDEIIILSSGTANGVNREASVVLHDVKSMLFDFAILAKGTINISNHVTVVGQVATNASASSNPVTTAPHSVPKAEDVITDAGIYIPEIEIPASMLVISTKITNDTVIPVTGDTYYHLEKGVDLGNHKTLSITGNGTLHLYVSEGWSSGNHSKLVTDPNVNVIIYVIDNSDVYITSHEFNGSIYAPHSKVTFHNASGSAHGGRNFHGSIIAKDVYLTGNHTVLEPDPDADMDDVTIEKLYQIKEWR